MKQNYKFALGLSSIILNINFFLIIVAILWGIVKKEPSMKFQEYGFITKLSAIQLLSIGIVCLLSYKEVKKMIWLLMAIGFSFLAADELLMIHENLDLLIHKILQLEKTTWSDKIDDFIILLYGIIGMVLMTRNYAEFIENKPGLLLTVTGFILMLFSVFVDTITNDTLVFSIRTIDANTQYHLAIIVEESMKIISEGTLLAGFLVYLKK